MSEYIRRHCQIAHEGMMRELDSRVNDPYCDDEKRAALVILQTRGTGQFVGSILARECIKPKVIDEVCRCVALDAGECAHGLRALMVDELP